MQKTIDIARKTLLYVSALVLVVGYPTAAMATSENPATVQDTSITEQSVSQAQEEPVKPDPVYTYDPTTKKWSSEEDWQYNTDTGTYEQPPAPIVIEPETSSLQNVGPQSMNEVDEDTDLSTDIDVDSDVDITNNVTSDAISGDALISSNTKAGSALTGDATAVANIINSVNSSIGTNGNQKVTTFTKDIMGDVNGDIILYPLLLKAMLEQEAMKNGTAELNASTDFNTNNNVNLNAQSGNATVEGNTEAGDATTGNATAMANVINILNSMIATQDSFIGTINIYGSLEGDILIAPDFIPQMLANNGGAGSSDTKLSSEDTTTIVNNITAVAESGAASVFGNTNGGNATTGDAESNVVIFNVTGRNIVAENSMLVFVNVLGTWVGMIVDAPAGATAAMIGSGVVSSESTPDLTLQSESHHGITNTINVTAGSGDATVANNTTGGNATSGNARAMANVANVSNSSLSLSGWFGILFINITGDWLGSFQIDTEYGNKPEEQVPQPTGPVQFVPEESKPIQNTTANAARVVVDSRFVNNSAPVALVDSETKTETTDEGNNESSLSEVLGDTDESSVVPEDKNEHLVLMIAGSILLVGSSVFVVRRFIL